MSDSLGWILLAFALYLLLMVVIGAVCAKNNSSTEDYFLGGRNLGAFVAALSAQASDMSGWLLMGLPGSVYALGTGQCWIAVGLFIGTVCNWLFISKRLRRYTIRANNSLTLPMFFENRFRDEKKILLGVSSVTIVIFFLVLNFKNSFILNKHRQIKNEPPTKATFSCIKPTINENKISAIFANLFNFISSKK